MSRHALYWLPPEGALAEFGAAWLGWDAARGREIPHPDIAGLPAPVREITRAPRRLRPARDAEAPVPPRAGP